MPTFIYARVSRKEQKTDSQLNLLIPKFPTAIVHEEKGSGVRKRPVLDKLLSELKSGDTLAVYALDRLGRNKLEAMQRLTDLIRRGIKIHSIREGEDFVTAEGELMAGVLLQVAQFEHRRISARIRAGIAAKKAKGLPVREKRRIPLSAVNAAVDAVKLYGTSVQKAAEQYGLSRQYLYSVMA